jgi:hypothetical protein
MDKKTEAIIKRLGEHQGAPIELSQEECWTIATLLDQINTSHARLSDKIEHAREILLPQTRSPNPSIIAIRSAIEALR